MRFLLPKFTKFLVSYASKSYHFSYKVFVGALSCEYLNNATKILYYRGQINHLRHQCLYSPYGGDDVDGDDIDGFVGAGQLLVSAAD